MISLVKTSSLFRKLVLATVLKQARARYKVGLLDSHAQLISSPLWPLAGGRMGGRMDGRCGCTPADLLSAFPMFFVDLFFGERCSVHLKLFFLSSLVRCFPVSPDLQPINRTLFLSILPHKNKKTKPNRKINKSNQGCTGNQQLRRTPTWADLPPASI